MHFVIQLRLYLLYTDQFDITFLESTTIVETLFMELFAHWRIHVEFYEIFEVLIKELECWLHAPE